MRRTALIHSTKKKTGNSSPEEGVVAKKEDAKEASDRKRRYVQFIKDAGQLKGGRLMHKLIKPNSCTPKKKTAKEKKTKRGMEKRREHFQTQKKKKKKKKKLRQVD